MLCTHVGYLQQKAASGPVSNLKRQNTAIGHNAALAVPLLVAGWWVIGSVHGNHMLEVWARLWPSMILISFQVYAHTLCCIVFG
jgi:hypothetical protein